MKQEFLERLKRGEFRAAVVGMGYVGLPLAVEFAEAGIEVTGIDISTDKIARLNEGVSYIPDIATERLAPLVEKGLLKATTDSAVISDRDVVCICVPTPLNKTKDPDVSMIMAVAESIAPVLTEDTVVVLESTTYPGFTREVFVPRLEETAFRSARSSWWPSAPSASILATRSTRPTTHPRSWAVSRRRAARGPSAALRPLHRDARARVLHGLRRDGQAA